MRLVLDSSVVIDQLRGHPGATELIEDRVRSGDQLWGIVITRAEVLAGMWPAERDATMRLLDVLSWLDIDVDMADDAASMVRLAPSVPPGSSACGLPDRRGSPSTWSRTAHAERAALSDVRWARRAYE